MKQKLVTWFAAGMLGLGAVVVIPQVAQADVGEGGVSARRVMRASATIQSIDPANRSLELVDNEGDVIKVNVPESIKAFERLNKGDKVNVTYKQALAIRLQAPGESGQGIQEKLTEEKSGSKLTMGRQIMASAEIVGVDAQSGLLRVKGPDGKVHKLNVEDQDLRQKLSSLKVGQHLKVTYNEAVATMILPSSSQTK